MLKQEESKDDFFKLFLGLAKECYPNFLFSLCTFALGTINILILSYKYDNYFMIEGIGISNLYINVTGNIICVGIISGLEILVSNALGVKNYYLMGLYVHRARIIALVYVLFIGVFNYFFGIKILSFLNVSPEILDLCRIYIFFNILMIMFNVPFNVNSKLINIIGKSHVNSTILISATILHFLWGYIFIIYLDLGIAGAGMSSALTEFISWIFSEFYVQKYFPYREAIFMINKDCFKGWKEYLSIAIPTTLYLFAEWMGYEIQALFAIAMTNVDYTVHIIMVNIDLLVFSSILSFGSIFTMRVAQSIVKDHISKSFSIIKAGFFLVMFNMIIANTIFIYYGETIISSFSTNVEIIQVGIKTLKVECFQIYFNAAFFVFNSLLRGIAYLNVPTIIGLINFYVILPILSYILGFYYGLGVVGIWIGMVIGSIILTIAYGIILLNIDLAHYQKVSIQRLNQAEEQIGEGKNELLIY